MPAKGTAQHMLRTMFKLLNSECNHSLLCKHTAFTAADYPWVLLKVQPSDGCTMLPLLCLSGCCCCAGDDGHWPVA